jgi:hypothetical protein
MKITNFVVTSAILFAVTSVAMGVQAQTTAPAPAPATPAAATCVAEKLSTESMIGDILDNPAAKAILIKHVPEIGQSDQIDQARGMSLRAIQSYAAETFTDKVLADLDTDFATIPVCAPAAPK